MKKHYLCTVFFMVLDLRLTKIDCRDDNHFFFYTRLIPKIKIIQNRCRRLHDVGLHHGAA